MHPLVAALRREADAKFDAWNGYNYRLGDSAQMREWERLRVARDAAQAAHLTACRLDAMGMLA
jgi:hypothetical protein